MTDATATMTGSDPVGVPPCPACGWVPMLGQMILLDIPTLCKGASMHVELAHRQDIEGLGVHELVRVGADDATVARTVRSWTAKVDSLRQWVVAVAEWEGEHGK